MFGQISSDQPPRNHRRPAQLLRFLLYKVLREQKKARVLRGALLATQMVQSGSRWCDRLKGRGTIRAGKEKVDHSPKC